MNILQQRYHALRKTFLLREKENFFSIWWMDKIRIIALRLLRGANGFLLDIGSGEGVILNKLIKNKAHLRIIGIDNSHKNLLKSIVNISKHNASDIIFLEADANRMCFKKDIFNVCLCLNFFYNLSSEKEAEDIFAEITKVLKPRGKLIFDIRNSKNPFLILKYKLAKFYDVTVKNQALRADNPDIVRQMLSRAGFKINKELGVGFFIKRFAPVILIEAEKT